MRKSTKIVAFTTLLLACAIGLSALFMSRSTLSPQVTSSGTALVGGAFDVTNHLGQPVSDKDFLGKHTLYYFGYTFCPDICPAELQVLSAALLDVEQAKDRFNLVFVTIDPKRDTPEIMKDYVSNFWPGTIGLTGSDADIRKIASAFRVYYNKVDNGDAASDQYLMDHSSITYLMGPDGKFVRHFAYGTSAADISKALAEALASAH